MKFVIDGPDNVELEMDFEFTFMQYLQVFKVNLDLAGIFFGTAFQHLNKGAEDYQILKKEISKYKASYKRLSKKHPIDSDEFLTIQQSKLRELEIYYEPVVRHFSTVKIMLVCCAETFVNELASLKLEGNRMRNFNKHSIVQKWVEIQEILELKKRFSIENEPLKSFSALVSERNKLVHFKGMKKEIEKLEIPTFIDDLRLTTNDCLRNIRSVHQLLEKINKNLKGASAPDWAYIKSENYRNPCFYLGDRLTGSVLWSDNIDDEYGTAPNPR